MKHLTREKSVYVLAQSEINTIFNSNIHDLLNDKISKYQRLTKKGPNMNFKLRYISFTNLLIITMLFSFSSQASVNQVCSILFGAKVVARDGTFLGVIAGKYRHNSIMNKYGIYGSKYSNTSIWNEYGNYGGKYSLNSPFNSYTTTPPVIAIRGKIVGNLTTNKYMNNAVNPYLLKACNY